MGVGRCWHMETGHLASVSMNDTAVRFRMTQTGPRGHHVLGLRGAVRTRVLSPGWSSRWEARPRPCGNRTASGSGAPAWEWGPWDCRPEGAFSPALDREPRLTGLSKDFDELQQPPSVVSLQRAVLGGCSKKCTKHPRAVGPVPPSSTILQSSDICATWMTPDSQHHPRERAPHPPGPSPCGDRPAWKGPRVTGNLQALRPRGGGDPPRPASRRGRVARTPPAWLPR